MCDDWIDVTIDGYEGTLMTVESFKQACEDGALIDYDGMGDMVKNGKIVKQNDDVYPWIKPSTRHTIPVDIDHILWYNK